MPKDQLEKNEFAIKESEFGDEELKLIGDPKIKFTADVDENIDMTITVKFTPVAINLDATAVDLPTSSDFYSIFKMDVDRFSGGSITVKTALLQDESTMITISSDQLIGRSEKGRLAELGALTFTDIPEIENAIGRLSFILQKLKSKDPSTPA